MRISSLFVALAVILFCHPTMLQAQELEVTPGKLLFSTNPGSSQTQQVYVKNKGAADQSFIFNLSDWLTDEVGEITYFEPGTIARSCSDWITVSPAVVTLQPNESATVNVTILVPEDEMTTKWAMLFVESAVEQTGPAAIDKDVQMGLTVSARIAVPIYQSPNGNTFYKGTIDDLEEIMDDAGNRAFESKVINIGDKILNCKVYYTIVNLNTAEEITSEPIEFSLLPESSKKIEYRPDNALKKGNYSVTAILDYGHNDELDGVQLDVEIK